MLNVYRLGYLFLLLIPVIQNNIRFYYTSDISILNVLIGSLPSFLAALSLPALALLVCQIYFKNIKINEYLVCFFVGFILIIYEIFQLKAGSLIFDYFDLAFSATGSILFSIGFYYYKITLLKKPFNDKIKKCHSKATLQSSTVFINTA